MTTPRGPIDGSGPARPAPRAAGPTLRPGTISPLHGPSHPPSVTLAVRRLAAEALWSGEPVRVKAVAAQLGLGPRRLQQLLRREETTFRAVLDELRRDLALARLGQGTAPLCDIATVLGFADPSAFTHAFRRWTGQAPSRVRGARER